MAEALRTGLERARLHDDVPVTVSVGVAALETGDVVDTWLRRADGALYAAKRDGRNRVALQSR